MSNFYWLKHFFIPMFLHRELTKVPHMATTAGDEQTVQIMLKRWQDPETGLDEAWREEYMVYLSFPDPKNPNKVTVGESTGCCVGLRMGMSLCPSLPSLLCSSMLYTRKAKILKRFINYHFISCYLLCCIKTNFSWM